jgi:hypothetical protein
VTSVLSHLSLSTAWGAQLARLIISSSLCTLLVIIPSRPLPGSCLLSASLVICLCLFGPNMGNSIRGAICCFYGVSLGAVCGILVTLLAENGVPQALLPLLLALLSGAVYAGRVASETRVAGLLFDITLALSVLRSEPGGPVPFPALFASWIGLGVVGPLVSIVAVCVPRTHREGTRAKSLIREAVGQLAEALEVIVTVLHSRRPDEHQRSAVDTLLGKAMTSLTVSEAALQLSLYELEDVEQWVAVRRELVAVCLGVRTLARDVLEAPPTEEAAARRVVDMYSARLAEPFGRLIEVQVALLRALQRGEDPGVEAAKVPERRSDARFALFTLHSSGPVSVHASLDASELFHTLHTFSSVGLVVEAMAKVEVALSLPRRPAPVVLRALRILVRPPLVLFRGYVKLAGAFKITSPLSPHGNRLRAVKDIIKHSLGMFVLLLPFFLRSTRPLLVANEAWWAVVAFAVVSAPTVQANARKGLLRIVGTAVGCLFGLVGFAVVSGGHQRHPGFLVLLTLWRSLCQVAAFAFARTQPAKQYGAWLMAFVIDTVVFCRWNGSVPLVARYAASRVVTTTVGAVTAMVVQGGIWPLSHTEAVRVDLSILLQTISELYLSLSEAYLAGPGPTLPGIDPSRVAALKAHGNSLLSSITARLADHDVLGPDPGPVVENLLRVRAEAAEALWVVQSLATRLTRDPPLSTDPRVRRSIGVVDSSKGWYSTEAHDVYISLLKPELRDLFESLSGKLDRLAAELAAGITMGHHEGAGMEFRSLHRVLKRFETLREARLASSEAKLIHADDVVRMASFLHSQSSLTVTMGRLVKQVRRACKESNAHINDFSWA